ncbi:hypothetical protein XELAEV_18035224mg [Xenopus laevis]|uniref:Uncharacterized protein n=1 Tax=Xenopus laevis TaxID=8355 RepID=A0A974CFI7_XENLA|nr:hypothetical protein XELAEV_18035224mg [Xenopus laevis]
MFLLVNLLYTSKSCRRTLRCHLLSIWILFMEFTYIDPGQLGSSFNCTCSSKLSVNRLNEEFLNRQKMHL